MGWAIHRTRFCRCTTLAYCAAFHAQRAGESAQPLRPIVLITLGRSFARALRSTLAAPCHDIQGKAELAVDAVRAMSMSTTRHNDKERGRCNLSLCNVIHQPSLGVSAALCDERAQLAMLLSNTTRRHANFSVCSSALHMVSKAAHQLSTGPCRGRRCQSRTGSTSQRSCAQLTYVP